MISKLYSVIHTVNGTVNNTYNSYCEELLINKLPKDILRKKDINKLLHYGSCKVHLYNTKHCFYFNLNNTI